MNIVEIMERKINLDPWSKISITTETEHHTLLEIATIVIENGGDYYFIKDDVEKIKDVSLMPIYIKEDWINYNKKELNIITLNLHIKEFEQRLKNSIESSPIKDDREREIEETLNTLKLLRRDLIIKGII